MIQGILIVVIGGAILALLGAATSRGRQLAQRVYRRVTRRPRVPRTHVVIEPREQFCHWSQEKSSPNPDAPGPHVAFFLHCVATNVTPGIDLQLIRAEITDIKGAPAWDSFTSWVQGHGNVVGAELPTGTPIDLMVTVVLQRPYLPFGPQRATMALYDHLGGRHKVRKTMFKDANPNVARREPPEVEGPSEGSAG